MCVERHLKSLTCLRVSGLSNYQLCPHVIVLKEVICSGPTQKFLLSLSPPLSLYFLLEEIHLWFRHISQVMHFYPHGSPLIRTSRDGQYLLVYMTKR